MTKLDDSVPQKNGDEAEIAVTATPVGAAPTTAGATTTDGGPPIPAGHSRFYCSKCHTVRFRFRFRTIHIWMLG
jgi:hypothetical protein